MPVRQGLRSGTEYKKHRLYTESLQWLLQAARQRAEQSGRPPRRI